MPGLEGWDRSTEYRRHRHRQCSWRWRHFLLLQQERCAKQCNPLQGWESDKEGAKKKSSSRGLGGMVLHPLPPPSPPALQPTRSITPPPLSQCRGICGGFFGPALAFATRSMEHTANQLRQWAREPDLGVKSFANSILLTSWSICIPYQGVLLDRTSNP